MPRQDLTGQIFARLTVQEFSHTVVQGRQSYWKCSCSCGNHSIVTSGNLKSGAVKSCGCLKLEANSERHRDRAQAYEGLRFGLLVIESVESCEGGTKCRCICDCGKSTVKTLTLVVNGKIRSCGCLVTNGRKRQTPTREITGTPTHTSWLAMLSRCHNPNHHAYDRYGGKGITVCDRWKESSGFLNFFLDMGLRPDGKSIDRIDNNGNYTPENCRWATRSEQNRNRKTTPLYEYEGRMVSCAELSEISAFSRNTIRDRIKNLGWTAEQAINTPYLRNRSKS